MVRVFQGKEQPVEPVGEIVLGYVDWAKNVICVVNVAEQVPQGTTKLYSLP